MLEFCEEVQRQRLCSYQIGGVEDELRVSTWLLWGISACGCKPFERLYAKDRSAAGPQHTFRDPFCGCKM